MGATNGGSALMDGLLDLDLGIVLEGGGEGAHGRAGDEGADDAAVVRQLQTNHLKEQEARVELSSIRWLLLQDA